MRSLLAFFTLGWVAFAASGAPLRPVQVRDVSLQAVALKPGERIASINVEVAGASFSTVRIPADWSFAVGAPVSGVAVLKGEAAHGVGMLFTTEEFQRFATLVFYDSGGPQPEFSIKVKLGLYLFDPQSKRESERVIELPAKRVILEPPDRAPAR
jgi:hypothetical protein